MVHLQLTLFLLIIIGLMLKKTGIITKEGQKCLSDITVNLILPCNIISSFMGEMNVSEQFIKNCSGAFLISLGIQMFSILFGKYCFLRCPKEKSRIFTYGIIFMLPFLFDFDFSLDMQKLVRPEYALNLIYLGLGASALCFVTWNYAVKMLGAVKTSVYIYIVPVITVVTSVIVLKEEITWMAAVGIGFTLMGLFLSDFFDISAIHGGKDQF